MNTKEKIASVVALLSAGLASVCCIGPLVLVGFGLGGVGLAASFVKYRPAFLAITAVILGSAFYMTYRKRQVSCADGSREFRSGSKTMKGFLWIIAVAALGTATFPSWSGLLLTSRSTAVNANAEKIVLSVSGMTCAGCVLSVEKSIKKLPGVQAVSVSLEDSEAVVSVEHGQVSSEALIQAVQAAGGYTAEVQKEN